MKSNIKNYQQLSDELNNLLELWTEIDIRKKETSKGWRGAYGCFGVLGEVNVEKFKTLITNAYSLESDIPKSLSNKEFEEQLNKLLYKNYVSKQKLNQASVKELYSTILKLPLNRYQVFSQLWGCSVNSSEPYKLGPYTVYNLPRDLPLLDSFHRAFDNTSLGVISSGDLLFIAVDALARDGDFAISEGRKLMDKFDNICSFLVGGRLSDYRVSAMGYKENIIRETHAYVYDSLKYSGHVHYGKHSILAELTNKPFSDNKLSDWIWKNLCNKQLESLEEEILTAIDWIGRALLDEDDARSFIQIVIGLEALFTNQIKGVESSGITAIISESAAFVLGDNKEERIAIEAKVRKFYKLRSSIVHEGKKSVSGQEVEELYGIVCKIIEKLIADPVLSKIRTTIELSNWVKENKFS